MLRRSPLHFLILPLVLAVAISACGDDDPTDTDDGQVGEFSATVSGAQSGTLTGSAIFGSTDEGFAIVMATQAGLGITVGRLTSGRPATGTYQVGEDPGEVTGVIGLQQGDFGYLIDGGSLTITRSDSGRLDGNFTFNATHGSGTGTVTVTGNFRAICVAGSGVTC